MNKNTNNIELGDRLIIDRLELLTMSTAFVLITRYSEQKEFELIVRKIHEGNASERPYIELSSKDYPNVNVPSHNYYIFLHSLKDNYKIKKIRR